ncbi:MAG: hypothetical protein HY810_04860 [Candidatus Omnitrophica bacterium]|nr:hypothetical protein [Candidatus Omnitrophota bacterium]
MKNVSVANIKRYERPEILSLLVKRVAGLKNKYRQNIAILGHKSLGKTRLIFELLQRSKCSEIIPIYINVEPMPINKFAKNFIGVILYQYLFIEDTGEIVDEFDFLFNRCKEKIPKTINVIKQIESAIKNKTSTYEIFSMVFELPHLLYEETKKPILLVLDEFHNLENIEVENPFLELSNKIMVQKHTMYLLLSSAIYAAENILSKKLSLLFGNFETIKIQPFDNISAVEFIKEQLDEIKITETLRNFLTFFTGGYPFYLEIITEHIKSIARDKKSDCLTEDILVCAIEETMYKDYGVINQYFRNKYHEFLNTSQTNLFSGILLLIAEGKKKTAEIAGFLGKKNHEINRCINRFIQNDIITKKGVFHEINDSLFVHWLKYVLNRQEQSFNMDIFSSAQEFKTNINNLLYRFNIESKKRIEQRIKELFETFENDIIEIDKKRFKLSRFEKVEINNNNGISLIDGIHLKNNWLCCVGKEFIDENKVGEFLAKVKNKNGSRKILVALEGIDANARLKALEEKVWIWDQKTINELFSLFEKPRFVK